MSSRAGHGIGRVAINIGIGEVILFVMYQVFYQVIISVNTTGSTAGVFKGSTGTLVNLVTLFYILGAALLPLALVKHAGFMFTTLETRMPKSFPGLHRLNAFNQRFYWSIKLPSFARLQRTK